MGKGDTYRPVDRSKWDAGWARLLKQGFGCKAEDRVKAEVEMSRCERQGWLLLAELLEARAEAI